MTLSIVTGSNAGIGLATAKGLAAAGHQVVIAGRNAPKCAAAADEVRAGSPGAVVETLSLDLASLASVRAAAAEVGERFGRVDVLVNNAGVTMKDRRTTADGFEMTMGVNHLGHFLLTCLLRPQLAAAGGTGRVVVVASDAHRFARGGLGLDDLQTERAKYRFMQVYGRSKLANILFARSAARRWRDDGITVNSLHPGFVATRLGRDGDGGKLGDIIAPLIKPFAKTPAKGARTSDYLASSAEVATVTGEYFVNCKAKQPNKYATDDDLAERLWDYSANAVGL